MPAPYRYARVLDAHLRQMADELGRAYQLELAAGFSAAAAKAGDEAGKILRDIARIIDQGVGTRELVRAHTTIAEKGQDSVKRSYDQTVTARNKRRLGPYRDTIEPAINPKNRRFADGKLRQALGSRDFWEADARGIRFINVDLLNRKAKQWARLSAGAGGRGSGSRQQFEVRWGNLVVAALGLNMRPSPAFTIPKGYWVDPSGSPVGPGARGSARFFPMGEGPRSGARSHTSAVNDEGKRVRVPMQRRRVTRGIEARNFLDAGVRRIARELGPTYLRMHEDWYGKRISTVRPASQTFRVSVRRNPAAVGVLFGR